MLLVETVSTNTEYLQLPPTRAVADIECDPRYEGKFVVRMGTAFDKDTQQLTHAVVVGVMDGANSSSDRIYARSALESFEFANLNQITSDIAVVVAP